MRTRLRIGAVLAGLSPLAAVAAAPVGISERAEPGPSAIRIVDGRNCRTYLPTIGATVAVPCPEPTQAPGSRDPAPAPEKRGGAATPPEPDATRPVRPAAPQHSMTAAHTPPPDTSAAREECRRYEPYLGRTITAACDEPGVTPPPSPAAVATSTAKSQSPTANARITPAPAAAGGGTSSCTSLVERAQLGFPLSIDDRERLRFGCRR